MAISVRVVRSISGPPYSGGVPSRLAAQSEEAARIGAADEDHAARRIGELENAQLPRQRGERCGIDRQPRFRTANLHVRPLAATIRQRPDRRYAAASAILL